MKENLPSSEKQPQVEDNLETREENFYILKVKIEEKELEIKINKEEVTFPEYITKETAGVEGYTRHKILFENLRIPLGEIVGDVQLPEESLFSDAFWSKCGDARLTILKAHKILLHRIMMSLSDGNFPVKTFNNVYGGVWGLPRGSVKTNIREKIFLQKLFHPKSMLNNLRVYKEENPEFDENKGYSPMDTRRGGDLARNLYLLERITESGVVDFDPEEVDSVRYPYLRRLLSSMSFPWTRDKVAIYYDKKLPIKDWEKGLEDLCLFLDENKDIQMRSAGGHGFVSNYTGLPVLFGEGKGHDGDPDTLIGYSNAMAGYSLDNKAFMRYLDLLYEKNPFIKKAIIEGEPSPFTREWKILRWHNTPSSEINEYDPDIKNINTSLPWNKREFGIPIVINNPEIPEVRWCHAQYLTIPTNDSINVLIMKSK